MRNWRVIGIVIVLVILLDFYIFQVIRSVSQGASARARMVTFSLYWCISIGALVIFAILPFVTAPEWPRLKNYIFITVLLLFCSKLLAAFFFLLDDIRRLIQSAAGKLFFNNTEVSAMNGEGISRSAFLSWLGIGLGGTLFSSLVYGFSNKYKYELRRGWVSLPITPASFQGGEIVNKHDYPL